MATLDVSHPQYAAIKDDLDQMRDCYAGSRAVKDHGTDYLPATRSMLIDGGPNLDREPGKSAYQAYKTRAIFPDLVGNAARTLSGLAFKDPSFYELPAGMEDILRSATLEGESLATLHRRIIEQVLLYGRFGVAMDVPDGEGLPYFVSYGARSVINWDANQVARGRVNPLNFVVTAEEVFRRGSNSDYDWEIENLYRSFELRDGVYTTWSEEAERATEPFTPSYRGRTLDFVPFTIIGAQDLMAEPGPIPLLAVSESALAIYRGEADLRQTLHLTAQDTLVLVGVGDGTEDDDDQPVRVGAGAVIKLPPDGSASFIGVTGEGLTEQRLVLSDDYKMAASEGARLLENTAAQTESGEALKVRIAAKTTTLATVALTASAGLEQALRGMALWMGLNPDEVKVTPNLDFAEDSLAAQDVLNLVQAKQIGLPLSAESIHANLQAKDYTELTFDEEMAKIKEEKANGITELLTPALAAGVATPGNEEPPDDDQDSEEPTPTEE